MTQRIKPELDDPNSDLAQATAFDYEVLLDHHLEEMLGVLSDLELRRLHDTVE